MLTVSFKYGFLKIEMANQSQSILQLHKIIIAKRIHETMTKDARVEYKNSMNNVTEKISVIQLTKGCVHFGIT